MALINEKETSFELVEALLKYIETLKVAGAVLVFLPGWNLIYSMQRHLETNPHFGTAPDAKCPVSGSLQGFQGLHQRLTLVSGSGRYQILPLHSQIPREEQRRVFEPVPENVTKVRDVKTLKGVSLIVRRKF